MHKPKITEVRNTISVKEDPTAAKASAPTYWPTIIVSATLYSCCSRFPRISGAENNSMDLVTFPLIKFICIYPCLSFSFRQLKRLRRQCQSQPPKKIIHTVL